MHPDPLVLILSSSGGFAHKVAAEIAAEELKAEGKQIQVLDLFDSYCTYLPIFGRLSTNLWDNAQRKGNLKRQFFLMYMQKYSDKLFFIPTYLTIACLLLRKKVLPKKIIATSPLNLTSISGAVRLVNRLRRKTGQKIENIDLYMVEPPTDKASYYLRPIRILPQKKRAMFKLFVLKPTSDELSGFKSEEEFWKTKTGLSLTNDQVVYQPILKKPFKEIGTLPKPNEACQLKLSTTEGNVLEFEFFSTLCKRHASIKLDGNFLTFAIAKEDKVGLIMLGGVPTKKAVLDYVKEAMQLNYPLRSVGKNYLFIGCGEHCVKKNLYEEVVDLISGAHAEQIIFVPFTRQPVEHIFARSDFSITRTGGMTTQEILATMTHPVRKDTKKILLHSEIKESPESYQEAAHKALAKELVLKGRLNEFLSCTTEELRQAMYSILIQEGIFQWEGENARYLKKRIPTVSIVTPQLFKGHLLEVFFEKGQNADLFLDHHLLLKEIRLLQTPTSEVQMTGDELGMAQRF